MRARAAEAGLDNAIIFNTCAVTGEAVRQSRQAIRKARRENPGAKIIVTGCAAQTEPDTYAAMDEVDAVLGNAEKLEAASYADFGVGAAERVRVNDIMSVTETAAQFVDSLRGPRPRLPAGAERLRPSLHLLHHSLRPRQFAQRAHGRGDRRSPPPGRCRVPGTGADRRRSDLLWRRSAGHAQPRRSWCRRSSSWCRS